MSRSPLIAQRTDHRELLLAQSAIAHLRVEAETIPVVCEPLITTAPDGRRVRALRLDLPVALRGRFTAENVHVIKDDGMELPVLPTPSPSTSLRVLIPLLNREVPVRIRLQSGALRAEASAVLDVPREWTIHLIHHSHLDIGYTDPQPRIRAEQRSYIDSALDLCHATDDWPEDARFRWTVESRWVIEDWMRTRPQQRIDELVQRVREGRVEISALPFNAHLDTCSTDELHEMLRGAVDLSRRLGIDIPSAMQTDVPGQPVGLPGALSDAGVRYLSVAHNWAGRSMPHTNGGHELPRLFRWRSPSGGAVLVWWTDSPHGAAYMEGPNLGLHSSYEEVDRLLPSYLSNLARLPHPYPPGSLGWAGEEAPAREPYPHDVLHLRTQGMGGDNAPARDQAARIARAWNEVWEYPRLITSTSTRFFEDAQARIGDQIPTLEGDWGDWWVEGVGSAALPQAIVREAQERVVDARFIAHTGQLLGLRDAGLPPKEERTLANTCYQTISLFNEHTWGASNSWRASDHGMDSGDLQWHWKASRALEAEEATREFYERATAELADSIRSSTESLASVLAVNTQSASAHGIVSFFLREAAVPLDIPLRVIDARTGVDLAHRESEQINKSFREAGRWVHVDAQNVPALGYVRLDIAQGPDEEAPAALDLHSPVIRNETLQVVFDPARSCISSIRDLTDGRELVNGESAFGFGQYIYDEYASAGGFNHQSNRTWAGESLSLLGSRRTADASVLTEAVDDGIEQRLCFEFTAPGIEKGWTTLRLRRGEHMLRIEQRLRKSATTRKESAYFAFPFAVADPVVHAEVTGGIAGDELPRIPGAPRHMRAVRHWIALNSADDGTVAWASRQAPLLQTGAIALPYAPFPDSSPREPGTLFSWAHNNLWDTNFPVEQAFETTFEYAIGVDAGQGRPADLLGARTAAQLTHPPVGVVAHGAEGARIPSAEGVLLALDGSGGEEVQVVTVAPGDEGELLVTLQSLASSAVETRVTMPHLDIRSARTSGHVDDGCEALELRDGGAVVTLPPRAVRTVALSAV